MKVKQQPADFRVEELTDALPGPAGDFAFYRLDKTGWTTPDALAIVRKRWKIELLFKWMKQHLHIKSFFGTTPNAVKSQLWIAVIALVLIHRWKHQLGLGQSPYEIAQILSITLCEKTALNQAFFDVRDQDALQDNHNQLSLFDL